MLAIWDDGAWQDAALLAVVLAVAYLAVIWLAALVWTFRDIQARTRDQFAQALSVVLIAVFNIPGLMLYLILRPKETMIDRYERHLESEALLHELNEQPACPSCRRKIDADFVACPFCRAKLRTACESCGRPLAQTWAICPYCAAERRQPAQPTRAANAAPATSAAETGRTRAPRIASTATYTPPAPQRSATSDAPADAPGA